MNPLKSYKNGRKIAITKAEPVSLPAIKGETTVKIAAMNPISRYRAPRMIAKEGGEIREMRNF